MMIIEKSLSPNIDESQRILAGPLIADLVQKATQFEILSNYRQAEKSNLIYLSC